jgi:hypothetical protein
MATISPRDHHHGPTSQAALRRLCHAIRAMTLLWVGWTLASIVLNMRFGNVFEIPHYALAAGFIFLLWMPTLAVGYCVWRLFGAYLRNPILTVRSARWMLRLGIVGTIVVLTALALKLWGWLMMAKHYHVSFLSLIFDPIAWSPNDGLRLLCCLFVIALAQILKAAAAVAEDHAGIV